MTDTSDRLTGLADRETFLRALQQRIEASAHSSTYYAVLFCDLDGFKLVNDLHSHEAGDAVLIEVARRLRAAVRADDTVARFGGDEFVILLGELDATTRAHDVAARIVDTIEAPITIRDAIANVGVSVGVAAGAADVTAAELVARADAAMYEAKRAGKRQVAHYDAHLEQRLAEHRRLGRELAAAVAGEQLELLYRPVIDLDSGELIGLEASLRWNHPIHGSLEPEAFIEVAESAGAITAIDRFVLSRAALDTCAFRSTQSELHTWVTVSGNLLLQPDGARWILETLAGAAATSGSIGIEISEDAVARNFVPISAALRDLTGGGVRVALDNFTGRLAIPQLMELRPHAVKLDRSFLDRLGVNIDAARAVRSVVGMIRPLGIAIVAKGVDTAEQLAGVVNLNCDAAQGLLAGAALPAVDLPFDALRLQPAQHAHLPRESRGRADLLGMILRDHP